MSLSQLKSRLELAALVILLVVLLALWRGINRPTVDLAHFLAEAASPTTMRLGPVRLSLELADRPLELARGLAGRASLNQLSGLLFIFDTDTIPSFWMKGMLFPLDIIWLDAAGRIVDITPNVRPESYPQIFQPAQAVRYALEVNAGLTDSFNLQIGDRLTPF